MKKLFYSKLKSFFLLTIFVVNGILYSRSPFRSPEPDLPVVTTYWLNDKQRYSCASFYFHEGALFHLYDRTYLNSFMLTPGPIAFRYELEKSVTGKELSDLIENLLVEIKEKKPHFSDFVILKKRDFNTGNQTGFLVLKFKNYPFVLKLFITTPEQFLKPFDYGFESCCFYMMGGVNRYLSGFTRLKNLERLKILVAQSPEWNQRVEFPRKWFWEPKIKKDFVIEGENIGTSCKKKSIVLPSVYALVCDEVFIERTFSLASKTDRDTALELTNFLQQQIDPHINNYVVDEITKKIAIIDTEHFPTMVGLEELKPCTDYISWYLNLSWKMWNDSFMKTKKQRRATQCKKKESMNFFASIV